MKKKAITVLKYSAFYTWVLITAVITFTAVVFSAVSSFSRWGLSHLGTHLMGKEEEKLDWRYVHPVDILFSVKDIALPSESEDCSDESIFNQDIKFTRKVKDYSVEGKSMLDDLEEPHEFDDEGESQLVKKVINVDDEGVPPTELHGNDKVDAA